METADDGDLGFTYITRKSGDVVIMHHGRLAVRLRGNVAQKFLQDVAGGHDRDAQQLMARMTGNYKHGNERTSRNHPRNRG
jgi:hypothetical protein